MFSEEAIQTQRIVHTTTAWNNGIHDGIKGREAFKNLNIFTEKVKTASSIPFCILLFIRCVPPVFAT